MNKGVKKLSSPLSSADALVQWLMFTIDQETYGVKVRHVREVLQSIEMCSQLRVRQAMGLFIRSGTRPRNEQ